MSFVKIIFINESGTHYSHLSRTRMSQLGGVLSDVYGIFLFKPTAINLLREYDMATRAVDSTLNVL